jgi:hypothetical protein
MRTYSTPDHRAALARHALLALLLAPWQASQAEPLGRLFFTPAERAAIDRPASRRAPPAPPPRLDGIVSPRSAAPTLFLNGQAHPATAQQVHLGDATADVRSPDGRLHRLRVGDPPRAAAP